MSARCGCMCHFMFVHASVCLSESVNNFHGDNPVCSYVCARVFL